MSYGSYKYFTRKQCNLLYKCFKRGQLTPPKDCRGKIKSPGFVYRYENQSMFCGFHLSIEEKLINSQIGILEEVISCICANDFDRAQAILNCEDEAALHDWLPEGVDPKKFWKVV